ncbi:hypothetical protein S479_23885 [Salmonella enterica subsp. enterica serovar Newport]|nr:hypothetical protein [Salmonella enterica]EEK2703141.1 hypothetical protein [Salmonella enterica subsp. enterica serovar Newport]
MTNILNVERPEQDIKKICAIIKLHPMCLGLTLTQGSIIDPVLKNTPATIFLETGDFELHRKFDGKLLCSFSSPFPFGIVNSVSHSENYFIEVKTPSKISFIPRSDFMASVEKENAWESIVYILTYLLDLNEKNIQTLVESNCVYDIIKGCLNQIWLLPEQERLKTSIYDFILRRHNISRSSITKIIRELNTGNYLLTKRGVLLNMNTLPRRF